jgi:carbon-monoxide dehydrogenase medium subunit
MHTPIPGLPGFDYLRPESAAQASRLLAEHDGEARALMGGTDLLVRMRNRFVRPKILLDLKHLPGMRDIVYDEATGLTVGAAVTMNQVAQHPAVQAHYPLLVEAANSVASYQLRNRATVGGNLCNASPAADMAPATLVLDARFLLHGPPSTGSGQGGEREIAASEFFVGPGQTALQKGEFMTAIRFPRPPSVSAGRYLKLGRNKVGDLSIVGVAVYGFLQGAEQHYHIGLASVAPTPLRVLEAEHALPPQPVEDDLARAADGAMQAASPIDDVRASAAYRKAMVRALALRGLRDVWNELSKA